ncbi:unnamed protein product, partial [Linum tenue]
SLHPASTFSFLPFITDSQQHQNLASIIINFFPPSNRSLQQSLPPSSSSLKKPLHLSPRVIIATASNRRRRLTKALALVPCVIFPAASPATSPIIAISGETPHY